MWSKKNGEGKLRTNFGIKRGIYQTKQDLMNYFRKCKSGTANSQSKRSTKLSHIRETVQAVLYTEKMENAIRK